MCGVIQHGDISYHASPSLFLFFAFVGVTALPIWGTLWSPHKSHHALHPRSTARGGAYACACVSCAE